QSEYMYQKTLLILLLLLSVNFSSIAQQQSSSQKHEKYVQQINGTDLSFSMEAIPGGSFKMGSDKGNPDEAPIHEVKLDPFWMSTFEVTWNLFEPFLYK